MNPNPKAEGALAALTRAAETARIRAIRFNSKLAIWKDGEVVLIDPKTNSNHVSAGKNSKLDSETENG